MQDVRNPSAPLMTLAGHSYAVRRVKWSPFSEHVLYTCRHASLFVLRRDSERLGQAD